MNEYLQSSGIVDVRVDDRMVHGIVATMWIPAVSYTHLDVYKRQVIADTDQTWKYPRTGDAPPQALITHLEEIDKDQAETNLADNAVQDTDRKSQLDETAAGNHGLESADHRGDEEMQDEDA